MLTSTSQNDNDDKSNSKAGVADVAGESAGSSSTSSGAGAINAAAAAAAAGAAVQQRVAGVLLAGGEVVAADAVVLAVGHSARTLYERLLERGVDIQPKPIAVGFRIEHPQVLFRAGLSWAGGLACETYRSY